MSALADLAATQHTRWPLHIQDAMCNIKKDILKAPIRMFPHFDKAMARNAGPSVWGLVERLALIKESIHKKDLVHRICLETRGMIFKSV